MLKQRITTALFLLPVVVAFFFVVELRYFASAAAVLIYLMALEWAKLAGFQRGIRQTFYAVLVSVVNFVIWLYGGEFLFWPSLSWPNAFAADIPMIFLVLGVVAICLAVYIVITYQNRKQWWNNRLVVSLMGVVILPAFFVSLISIRKTGYLGDFYHGGGLLLLMFCLIWAADTGAYFTGKALGKSKLAPTVSPNKTWEGVAGGVALSMLVGWIGITLIGVEVTKPLVFTLVLLGIAFLSVLGDLFESALKRKANIKDSGKILPGHGGLLDRLDSTLVVAPVYFLVFSYMGWF
ncbi:phosphatidate cytidylyltransferase [Aliikangiella sp. G2MR2-5]|uniref:phosphatidate cytidylyltransferase n=1 Tax=Aliikangiella sp. G2MR2-5 TaxID=2788943 RepID=UPI0018AC6592|nr:phosphatidate cytidylyltransferase [Aliikangiella sp. G2MR2-5]